MPSLTPQERNAETAESAFRDGMLSFVLTLIPSSAAVYAAMKSSPMFVKSTNVQSRTALVIMPPLFAFAFSSETMLNHRMNQMANQTEHSRATAEWAEHYAAEGRERAREDLKSNLRKFRTSTHGAIGGGDGVAGDVGIDPNVDVMTAEEAERQLTRLYHQPIENSGVRIVSGDSLGPQHYFANFFQENPFKILTAAGVPTILYIFRGKSGQKHLQLQSMIMHTRVYGQFAVIGMLLSLMGFKSYMDSAGKYITEHEAIMRVEEMQRMRANLKETIVRDKRRMDERDRVLRGSRDRTTEHVEREAALQDVDDFEAQIEKIQEKEEEKRKEKKRMQKERKNKEKASATGKISSDASEVHVIDAAEADKITAA